MKIVAWVPIKMNNERLPGKNILPLAGKPLCQHILGELQQLEGVHEVYAFCSDSELDQYLPKGVERIDRDIKLNSFSTKINDVIKSFAETIEADIYIYAQVTSPFLKHEAIQAGLDAVVSGEYDSALSVKMLRDFLWADKEKPMNYDPASIARTQDLSPYYQETGGFYIYTKELIEKYNRRTGFKPYLMELSEIESVDIDYREDYELAQAIALKDRGRVNDAYNVDLLSKWCKYAEQGKGINELFAFWGETFAIYGGGVIGKSIYASIKDKSCIKYFIDKDPKEINGVACINPQNINSMETVDLIVVTPGFDIASIRKQLWDINIPIFAIDEMFDATYQDDGYVFLLKLMNREHARLINNWKLGDSAWKKLIEGYEINLINGWINNKTTLNSFIPAAKMLGNKLIIPSLDVILTTKCSLKCKKCSHLIPAYTHDGRQPFDIAVEEVICDIDKLLSAVDYIGMAIILGGEPLLYKDIDIILEHLSRCNKVGRFQVVTNSTIVPQDSTCEYLSDDKFCVYLNDYGLEVQKVNAVREKLINHHVKFRIGKDRIWYDFGGLSNLNLSANELKHHYEHCSYSQCKALMQGELHTCALHKHGQRTGVFPYVDDSLHIHEFSEQQLREELIKFYLREGFSACNYCNAPIRKASIPIVAGEQEE